MGNESSELETIINNSIFNKSMQMKTSSKETKLKRDLKVAEDFLSLKTINPNVLVEQMEEMIKMRELPVEQQIKMRLKKDLLI